MAETKNLPVNLKRVGIKLAIALVMTGVLYWLRPLFHGIVYRAAFSPGMLFAVGLPFAVGVALFFSPPLDNREIPSKVSILTIVFIIGIVLALALGGLGSLFEERELSKEAMENAEQTEKLPEVNAENPRITPRAVANIQTRGSVSYRQHQLGISDISRTEDGRLAWGYPIQPDQFQNQLRGNQRGILLSDMTTMEDREMLAYDQQNFKNGENMLLHRSAEWNIKKTDYWAQYRDEPTPFVHNGEAYMVYPKTGHEWHLLPVPHTTPTWEGVALVHTDGTIEHMSPEEAQESEILEGQRIYPLYNSKRLATSLQYRNGIINQMPLLGTFENVVVPADLPEGAGNSQPFVIDMKDEQMSYVYTLEPAGERTRGLAEVWFFNSKTGKMQYYSSGESSLLGPERASDVVRSEDSRTQWGSQFEVVEPIPTVIDNQLWWHTKVVPTDNTDVTRNSFVNARTGNVVEMENTESVVKFMSGKNLEELENSTVTTKEGDEEAAGYVVIRENGEVVDEIPIQSGQDVKVEFGNTTQSGTQKQDSEN